MKRQKHTPGKLQRRIIQLYPAIRAHIVMTTDNTELRMDFFLSPREEILEDLDRAREMRTPWEWLGSQIRATLRQFIPDFERNQWDREFSHAKKVREARAARRGTENIVPEREIRTVYTPSVRAGKTFQATLQRMYLASLRQLKIEQMGDS